MSVRDYIDALLRDWQPVEPEPQTYREQAPVPRDQALAGIRAEFAARALRIRALERQLAAQGIEPASTPDADDLERIAGLLEGLARGEQPSLSALELRRLAGCIRGLATWGES